MARQLHRIFVRINPLDHLAAHLDPGYEGLEAAKDIVPHAICWPRHWNVRPEFAVGGERAGIRA